MSLSISLYYRLGVSKKKRVEVFYANITSNLRKMTEIVDLYISLFRPHSLVSNSEEMEAFDLVPYLVDGIKLLEENKDTLIENFNPSNGWGSYDDLLKVCKNYLEACNEFPDSKIFASN